MGGERFYCLAEYENEEKSAAGNSWTQRTWVNYCRGHVSPTRAHVRKQFKLLTLQIHLWSGGLPRCKNLTRFSLFGSFCFAVRYCLKCFCFLCFTSSVSFTGSYTEVKPEVAKQTGERYPPKTLYLLVCGINRHLGNVQGEMAFNILEKSDRR